jgi:hypothetical protein
MGSDPKNDLVMFVPYRRKCEKTHVCDSGVMPQKFNLCPQLRNEAVLRCTGVHSP